MSAASELERLRGRFVLTSEARIEGASEIIRLGEMQVFPASEDPDAPPGQWVLWVEPDTHGTPRVSVFIEVASRLGMLPVRFSPKFCEALKDTAPICLVADTNTLYHGTLTQSLALRTEKATHVAIADQALMELQRHRERAYAKPRAPVLTPIPIIATPRAPTSHPPVSSMGPDSKKRSSKQRTAAHRSETTEASKQQEEGKPLSPIERWNLAALRQKKISAAGRAIRRIEDSGHIVHVVRPPDAMVRYFGGGRRSGEGDTGGDAGEHDELVGENALRDRLILEALRQQRVVLPGVAVWLLTDDANLAAQAKIEGFNVGFGWLADAAHSNILSSPYINPRTLQLAHVRAQDFLDELLWSCGNLTVQQDGAQSALNARLPSDSKRRDRVLAEMREVGYCIRWEKLKVEPLESRGAAVPKKAPAPDRLVAMLLRLDRGDMATNAGGNEAAYLRGLGWAAESGKTLTARGSHLARGWMAMRPDEVRPLAKWLDDAALDISKLAPLVSVLKALGKLPNAFSESDKELGTHASESPDTVSAQLSLANAFGLVVRIRQKTRLAHNWQDSDADKAIIDAISIMVTESELGGESVSVSELFTRFTRASERPMSLSTFRSALHRLDSEGEIELGASAPDRGVIVRSLLRISDGDFVRTVDVNFGDGASLLPGKPSKVVALARRQS